MKAKSEQQGTAAAGFEPIKGAGPLRCDELSDIGVLPITDESSA
jgi:hypothetical protein